MRVASPFNDYSKDSLNLYRVIDPEIWTNSWAASGAPTLQPYMAAPKRWDIGISRFRKVIPGNPILSFSWIRCQSDYETNYVKKFNTSIHFWHTTGGGLDEETIQELTDHGYAIIRNGVSKLYTEQKKPYHFRRSHSRPYRRYQIHQGHPQLEADVLLYPEK